MALSPVLQWLGVSADIRLNINLVGALGDIFGDPSDISIFSGSLGSVFQAQGIDTQIGNAVAAELGLTRVSGSGWGWVPAGSIDGT